MVESRERGNAAPENTKHTFKSTVIKKFPKMMKAIDDYDFHAEKCLSERYHADLSEMELNQKFMKTTIYHINMGIL